MVHRGRFGFRSCFGRKLVRATVCRSFLPQAGCRAPRKVFEQRVVDALLRNRRVRSLSRGDVFRDRRLIAEDIADLVDSTYGLDPAPLRRIVERQRLDVFLLRRIRRNGGYRRAYYLHLLSRMPVDEKTVRAVERYTHSRNRYVRFCALSVQMMADMSALSSKIDAYSHRLSYFELSEVLRMLRQNVQPVDYEPLILSPNRNLRMLGLSVVWRFGIEDAEEILLRIVAENRSEESVGAMYVLCTLHSVITRPEVEKFVGGMNPVQRRVLLRYIARQGYSANALQVFIPEEEKRYYVSLVDSYKLNVG